MIGNYLRTALRNLLRHKGISFINILGLAIGLACCVLIFLYVHRELTFDTCYDDSERIYRVCMEKQGTGWELSFAFAPYMLTPTLKERFPEVEAAFRLGSNRPSVVRWGEIAFLEDRIRTAESDMFAALSYRFVSGDPNTALDRPLTVLITEAIAYKYFGEQDPLGQSLQVDTLAYEVTGVAESVPDNTHLKWDILCTESEVEGDEPPRRNWITFARPTYVKLQPGVDVSEFEAKITGLPYEYAAEELAQMGEEIRLFLQPIEDIHFGPHYRWDIAKPGNPRYVFGMAAIGVLVLLIASVNFVNLSTARSAGRAVEVGVRKAAGAYRSQLFRQFISESIVLVGVSLAVALVLAELALPQFNELAGTAFTPAGLFQPTVLIVLLMSALAVAVLAGSYPAVFLSRFEPARVLKSGVTFGSRRSLMRKVLVVGQFAICAALIVGIFTVRGQLDYMKNRPLGFGKEGRLVVEMPRHAVTSRNCETVKSEFVANSSILGATLSSSVPGRWNYQWRTYLAGQEQETTKRVNWYEADWDFIDEFGLEIVAGRNFQRDRPGDMIGKQIINEAAVAAFGWSSPDEAIGQHLNRESHAIIGVVRDFHLRGLQGEVEPFAMYVGDEDYRYLTLRTNGEGLSETVTSVRATFEELFPEGIFGYFFLDVDFNRQYQSEDQLAGIITGFTTLGILVACLGLFALSAFMAEQRVKELGIRKVLGASAAGITGLLTREFLVLVLVANLIAWPFAYLAMDHWLEGFAYHISVGWGTLVLASVLTFLIAWVAVSYQAIKAARANPVEALRYE